MKIPTLTGLETIIVVIATFIGIGMITAGINSVIPIAEMNPYVLIILGAFIIIGTGWQLRSVSKK